MMDFKRFILNLFEMNCVSYIIYGLWWFFGNWCMEFNDIEYWMDLVW